MQHNPSGDSASQKYSIPTVVEPETSPNKPSLEEALMGLDINLADELTKFREKTASEKLKSQSTDDQSEALLLETEMLKPANSDSTVDEDDYESIPALDGFAIIDGIPNPETNVSTITVDYAPIAIDGHDSSSGHQNLDLNFSTGGKIVPFQFDYVASSQELLRQIQSGATTAPEAFGESAHTAIATTKRPWGTPAKVISIAGLSCVIAGASVYTYLNPSILSPLIGTNVGISNVTTTNSLGQIIQSPNLAANEFTELNLSNLNTVKIAAATPTVRVNLPATVAPTGVNPAAVLYQPQNIVPPSSKGQTRLSDSLIQSLLPSSFQNLPRQIVRPIPQPVAK